MSKIDVVVVAEKGTPYCASCGGGRTLEDITESLAKQLRQRYGDAVDCRFVDAAHFLQEEGASEAVRGAKGLPLVMIGGKVRYRGLFSPTFIRRDVNEMVQRSGHKPAREDTKARSMRIWLDHVGRNWATDSRPAAR